MISKLTVDTVNGIVYSHRGNPIGSINPSNGYVFVAVGNRRLKRFHIIWWKHYGFWPTTLIDHDNRIKHDDRIDNLKANTPTGNALNNNPRNHGLPRGVTTKSVRVTGKPFKAQITENKRMRHLGYYATVEEASTRFQQEYLRIHGKAPPS